MISLGHIKNALDVYLRINMWENVIACYNSLDLKHKVNTNLDGTVFIVYTNKKLLLFYRRKKSYESRLRKREKLKSC